VITSNSSPFLPEKSLLPDAEIAVTKTLNFEAGELHSHDFIEICFVQAGKGWHMLGGRAAHCGPGSVYVINSEDAHMFVSDFDSPLALYTLSFRPGFFDMSLMGKQGMADVINHFLLCSFQHENLPDSMMVNFSSEEISSITRLYESMLDEYNRHEPGFKELIRSWTIELLVYIFRKYREARSLSGSALQSGTGTLDRAFAYIQQHYAEPISLEKLAVMTYMSPKYFSKVFKIHTGYTVTDYTQRLRIAHACEMLSDPDISIAEIAEKTGYRDVKYFAKIFRRIMGMSPVLYRMALKGVS